jgi:hypothetical protein
MTTVAEWLSEPGAGLEVENDFDEINTQYLARGWTDGLPVVPPTRRRIEDMLGYCDRPWNAPVATIAPNDSPATPLRIAVNAVMAGCRPEYFPVIITAIEAMCEPAFNLNAIQSTTHLCAPLVIVNGPIAKELGINSGYNAFGPGKHANATIGRAIRLALINIGGAVPEVGDMATLGSPAKYSYCVAENEPANPWQALHVELGHPAWSSAVTVMGLECPHNVHDRESSDAEGILTTIAGTMANTGANDMYYAAHPLVVLCPEHATTIAHSGWKKARVKQFLFERARLPLYLFSKENIERRFRTGFSGRYATAGMDAPVLMVQRPEHIVVIVVGGAGKHSACFPTFGETVPITRTINTRDGKLARSIHEFRSSARGQDDLHIG